MDAFQKYCVGRGLRGLEVDEWNKSTLLVRIDLV